MKRTVPPPIPQLNEQSPSVEVSSDEEDVKEEKHFSSKHKRGSGNVKFQFGGKSDNGPLPSPIGSAHSFDMQVANWRMEKLEVDSRSGSEDEFFDCQGNDISFELHFY